MELKQEEVKQLEELSKLFETRSKHDFQLKSAIIEKLGPTAVAAIYQFFDVGYDGIVWTDVQIIDNVITFTLVVTYINDHQPPQYIERFSPLQVDGNIASTQRSMRIGIPAGMVFKMKEELVGYLRAEMDKLPPQDDVPTTFVNANQLASIPDDLDQPESPQVPTKISQPDAGVFDMSRLTKQQVQCMLHLQHYAKGKLQ